MKKILYFLPILIFADTINKIEYKGLIHLSPQTANTIIKITPHSEFDIKKIDESIKALYKTGYFKTIKADFNKGILTFIVIEKPTITKIKTENVSEELKKALKEQNLFPKKGEILEKEKLKKLKEFIQNYYLAKGYFNTTVKIETLPITQTKIKLKIIVSRGKEVICTIHGDGTIDNCCPCWQITTACQ